MKHKNHLPGQTLVEFALIIPLVLMLLLGFLDLGRAIFYYSSLSNAVREGTRQGIVMESVGNQDPRLISIVSEYAFGLGPTNVVTIDVSVTNDADGYRDTLQITANHCFVPVTPGIASLFGCIPLDADSIMRFEPCFK